MGINHNGDLDLALKMIDVARESGADAVKFQTFKAEEFCGDPQQMFTYQSQGRSVTESMLAMFKRYEFDEAQWRAVKAHCAKVGITFFSSPQNRSDLALLQRIGVPAIKVGSDDFSNLPLLRHYAGAGLPLILSCGMSDLADAPGAGDGGLVRGAQVALLLCTSQYPTPDADVNLAKLGTLQQAFPGLLTGFSDHTQGPLAASLAVARGRGCSRSTSPSTTTCRGRITGSPRTPGPGRMDRPYPPGRRHPRFALPAPDARRRGHARTRPAQPHGAARYRRG